MKLLSHLPKQSFWLYLGPVLNVLTLLLIFFLLGSTFVVRSGVHVALPENASRLTGFDHAHVITVSNAGDPMFFLDGKPATVKSLKDDLPNLKRESRKIIIHADVMAPYGRVLQAGNIALGLGFEVAYATQPPPSSGN